MASRHAIARLALALSLAMALASGFVLLFLLADEVVRKVRLLETARSDNVQWTLSQAEVEFLELSRAVESARRTPAPDLAPLRRDYDVFYSRVQTISSGRLYSALVEDPRYAMSIAAFEQFLADTVGLIDGTDTDLAANLKDLSSDLDALRPRMREISLVGLETFAAEADARRKQVAQTLTRLGLTTGALLTVLAMAAVVLAFFHRLSERRASALQRATTQLNTMVETSLDAIIVANTEGRILAFNSAAETIFGWPRAEVIGRDMGEIIVPEKYRAAHAAGMKRYRETREVRVIGAGRLRLEAMKADGSVFPVELAIQSAALDDGEVFVSFLRDISHRVAAEQELIEARDKAVAGERAKSNFLAVMSHELRTPLNGVLGTLSLLRNTDLDTRQSRLVSNMEASAALLLSHANDVLDISKYEAGKLELNVRPTDLDALVDGVLAGQRDLAHAARNRLDFHWTGRPPGSVLTDPERVKQILVNLVGNAIKFTRGGRIAIELVDLDPRHVAGHATEIEIRVHDTGIGIAPSDMSRVFEDFETGDPSYGRVAEGTGLGLGIARRLASALGGEIGATSALGAGSTFWLRLPVQIEPEAEASGRGISLPGGHGVDVEIAPSLCVLIVEDNAINREVLSGMLREDGHRVVEAHDGLEGVRLACGERFDIILMDMRMPQLDGFEATRRIRASSGRSGATPIIAVTAQALPKEMDGVETQGITDWITKPIDRSALRRALLAVARNRDTGPVRSDAQAAGPCCRDNPGIKVPETVDGAILAELIDVVGPSAARRLLADFIREVDQFADVASSFKEGSVSTTEFVDSAHKQAGSAGTFGCLWLKSILNEIEETLLVQGDGVAIGRLLESFNARWDTTRREILAESASLDVEPAGVNPGDKAGGGSGRML